MRELLKTEEEFIEEILSYKKDFNMKELQSGRLLKKKLKCDVCSWSNISKGEINFYYSSKIQESDFYSVIDYISFIKELEEKKFITLLSYNKHDGNRILYVNNKVHYSKDKPLEHLGELQKSLNQLNETHFFYLENKENEYEPIMHKDQRLLDINEDLEQYLNKIIYPLPLLDDFCRNGFKNIEKRNFERQMCLTKIATGIAIVAVLISTIFGVIQSRSNTTLEKKQFEKIIKTLEEK